MSAADRLLLLDVLFDVHVGLHADGHRLAVRGPAEAVRAAAPMLKLHKRELLAHLRTTSTRTTTQEANNG